MADDEHTDRGILDLFRSLPGGAGLRSAAFVPVIYDGRTRAVLVVTLAQPLLLGEMRLLALLELLAADAAPARPTEHAEARR